VGHGMDKNFLCVACKTFMEIEPYLSIYVLLNIMLIHPCMIMLRICGCALLIHVSVILCLFKLYHYLVT
jgi:hypothetical protein